MQDEYAREMLRDLSALIRKQLDLQKDLSSQIEELRMARLADVANFGRFSEKIVEILRGIIEQKKSVKDLIEEVQLERFPHYSKHGLAEEIGIDRTALFDLQAGRRVSKNVIAKTNKKLGIPVEVLMKEQPPRQRRRRPKRLKKTH